MKHKIATWLHRLSSRLTIKEHEKFRAEYGEITIEYYEELYKKFNSFTIEERTELLVLLGMYKDQSKNIKVLFDGCVKSIIEREWVET